jgi:putative glutamine amidotransferase
VRPLIGVTTSEVRLAERVELTPEGEPPRPELALGLSYIRAIEQAGGIPVVVPPLEPGAAGDVLAGLSGVCLSGGPDLDPRHYSDERHPRLGPTEPELDRFELTIARLAYKQDIPILAICRGLQALNVANGGSLHQHLPESHGERIEHRQPGKADRVTHHVRIDRSSRLGGLLGGRRRVNSFHHQAVDRVGVGLAPTAWASDGVVEALEAPAREFVLAVQWHAECLTARPEQAALFASLVEASASAGRSRRRVGAG